MWGGGVPSCGCSFVVLFLSGCCVCDLFLFSQVTQDYYDALQLCNWTFTHFTLRYPLSDCILQVTQDYYDALQLCNSIFTLFFVIEMILKSFFFVSQVTQEYYDALQLCNSIFTLFFVIEMILKGALQLLINRYD